MQARDYRHVPLYRRDGSIRAEALVDADDYKAVMAYRWHVGSGGYARRNVRGVAYTMHRVIMGLSHGDEREVDHINRDKFDNRRQNLRVVTPAQNAQNVPSHHHSSSRFRAVYWEANKGLWRARPRIGGRPVGLGYFDSEIAAACAVEEWRRRNMPFAEPDPELSAILSHALRLAA